MAATAKKRQTIDTAAGEIVDAETGEIITNQTGKALQAAETAPAATPLDLPAELFSAALDRRKANRAALLDWIRAALVEGIDYGRIHSVGKNKCQLAAQGRAKECQDMAHWSKPSLYKPGAEKICGMLGVTAHFPTLPEYERAVLEGRELRQIIIRCELHDAAGRVVADGVGARSLAQDSGDLNKALKMAEKSAHIDAALRMAGLSEVFTQDLEDMTGAGATGQDRKRHDQPKGGEKPNGGQTQTGPENGQAVKINSQQQKRLEAVIKHLRLDPERVKAWCKKKWSVERFQDLSFEQYRELDGKLESFAEQAWNEIKDQPIDQREVGFLTDYIVGHGLDLQAIQDWAGVKALYEITNAQLKPVWNHLHKLGCQQEQAEYEALSQEEKRRRGIEMMRSQIEREEKSGRNATWGT